MRRIIVFVLALFALPAFAEMETYTVDRQHCSLTFEVSAQLHQVHGISDAFSGTITGDPADIMDARIEIHLSPKTFDTKNKSRDKVMREKSLEVEKYPSIDFISSTIESSTKELVAGKPTEATIKGTLKLHGLEKEMSVPVKIMLEGDTLTADGDMALVLDEWKILRPKILFFRLQNDIKIHFKIGAVKRSAQ